MPSIDDVRRFWDSNPLFTGESLYQPGSHAFFEDHNRTYNDDVFAGTMDERIFPDAARNGPALDLGCGIGFWLGQLSQRGFTDLTGADLSIRSIEIARQRCDVYGINAKLVEANAEKLPFADATFTHVNCQGVVHHTTHPDAAINEIARVLRRDGTATISVYYRNFALRAWPVLRLALKAIPIGLSGRGREKLSSISDSDEIVRLYDGAANPIGRCYDRAEFEQLLAPLHIEQIFFHFFPARALPVRIPRQLHRILNRALPFMIVARVRKR